MEEKSETELVKELVAAWERDPRIDLHHNPVQAQLHDGTLVLEGRLDNIAAKKLALTTAHEVAGRVPVLDHLRVTSAGPHDDGSVRDEFLRSLMGESAFNEYEIRVFDGTEWERLREAQPGINGCVEVKVNNAVIHLSGRVWSLTHRRLAEVLAWWVSGSEAVDNRLRVTPPEQENEGELADAVRITLEKDPLVHASQLSVNVRGHAVTLDGSVASKEEKKLAVLDAWYVPGVREVIDRIEARG